MRTVYNSSSRTNVSIKNKKTNRLGNDRVQIRVYRGPETGHGDKKFAPWGFLVRQPADD